MNAPIGIMDSGVGGLTVWSAIRELLPRERFVYFSDHAHAPYGEKPPEFIVERSRAVLRLLLEWDIKLCVVACNTATTNSISTMRKEFPLPFVGVEPAIKPAAELSASGRIGVLATAGTLSSPLYQQTAGRYASDSEVITVIGSGLVEGIESGDWDGPEFLDLLHSYLEVFARNEVDVLVLGCTHYPFLSRQISDFFPYPIRVLDSSSAVAKRVRYLLGGQHALSSKTGGKELWNVPPAPDWLEVHGLYGLPFPSGEDLSAPGYFLSSGPIDSLTRALNYLGYPVDHS